MPHPYPGQQWRHGWIPISPAAAIAKNHGRKPNGAHPNTKGTPSAPSRRKAAVSPAAGDSKTGKAAPTAAPKGKEFLDQHYGQWRDSLSPAHEKALRFYQSPGFSLMNGQLRGLDKKNIRADVSFNDSDLERARKASKDLAAAIRKAPPLTEPITVHRGFSADQFGELNPGRELVDKAFTSTSLTPDVAAVGKASRPATAEIVLPKGTRAAAGSSRELILPPGSRFRVLSRTTRNGIPHVRMELIL